MGRLHREVLAVLVAEIVDGSAAPGTWLPREVDLAARFGISRGIARECIRALEERHLVTVRHGRGAMVSPAADWNVLDIDVVTALLAGRDRWRVLGEYLECRRILEVEAAGLAAERATTEHLFQVQSAYLQMEKAVHRQLLDAGDAEAERAFIEADLRFHNSIMEATGNRALAHMLEPMHHALFSARCFLARPQARQERGLPEHRRILESVQSRDPYAARSAMTEHLGTVEGYLKEYEADYVQVH